MLCFNHLNMHLFAGLNVDFGEHDIIVHERDRSLKVAVIYRHLQVGMNVSVQVVPMTLAQFTATGRPLPLGVSVTDDPAEEGNNDTECYPCIYSIYIEAENLPSILATLKYFHI